MATWPVSLPRKPRRNGFSEALQDNAIRFAPEVGPSKSRRRATASGSAVTMMFTLTGDQWDTLVEFYRTTLSEVSTFIGTGEYGFSGTFEFSAPPQRTAVGPSLYSVSLQFLKLA